MRGVLAAVGGAMSKPSLAEAAAFALLFAVVGYCWGILVPAAPWSSYFINPAYFALVGASVTSAVLLVLRLWSPRQLRLERLALAVFLGSMPLIYLWSALWRSAEPAQLFTEAIGLLVFGGIAVLGYRGSPWWLAAGIAAHGLLWDAWHHGHAQFIEAWYPLGCLLFDVALGALVMAQQIGQRAVPRSATDPDGSLLRSSGAE